VQGALLCPLLAFPSPLNHPIVNQPSHQAANPSSRQATKLCILTRAQSASTMVETSPHTEHSLSRQTNMRHILLHEYIAYQVADSITYRFHFCSSWLTFRQYCCFAHGCEHMDALMYGWRDTKIDVLHCCYAKCDDRRLMSDTRCPHRECSCEQCIHRQSTMVIEQDGQVYRAGWQWSASICYHGKHV
jgi:hypothetical protein